MSSRVPQPISSTLSTANVAAIITGAIDEVVDPHAPNNPETRSLPIRRATEIALHPWQIQA
jgi:hypothetical protein